MSAKARAVEDWESGRFVIYSHGQLVGRANLVSGLDDALDATSRTERVPDIGLSGLDESGVDWFTGWSATLGEKRDLTIRANVGEARWIRISGASIVLERENFQTAHTSYVLSIDCAALTTGP